MLFLFSWRKISLADSPTPWELALSKPSIVERMLFFHVGEKPRMLGVGEAGRVHNIYRGKTLVILICFRGSFVYHKVIKYYLQYPPSLAQQFVVG